MMEEKTDGVKGGAGKKSGNGKSVRNILCSSRNSLVLDPH